MPYRSVLVDAKTRTVVDNQVQYCSGSDLQSQPKPLRMNCQRNKRPSTRKYSRQNHPGSLPVGESGAQAPGDPRTQVRTHGQPFQMPNKEPAEIPSFLQTPDGKCSADSGGILPFARLSCDHVWEKRNPSVGWAIMREHVANGASGSPGPPIRWCAR